MTGAVIGLAAPVPNKPSNSDRTELEPLTVLVPPRIPASTAGVARVVIEGGNSDRSELDRPIVSVFLDALTGTDAVGPGEIEASESESSESGG